jgi:hypothetical protein
MRAATAATAARTAGAETAISPRSRPAGTAGGTCRPSTAGASSGSGSAAAAAGARYCGRTTCTARTGGTVHAASAIKTSTTGATISQRGKRKSDYTYQNCARKRGAAEQTSALRPSYRRPLKCNG